MVSIRRRQMRLGVSSDTHGLLRPEAIAAPRGSDLIIHAGDIGALTGIGLATALAFAREGQQIVIPGRHAEIVIRAHEFLMFLFCRVHGCVR
jgi:hypothetical protein